MSAYRKPALLLMHSYCSPSIRDRNALGAVVATTHAANLVISAKYDGNVNEQNAPKVRRSKISANQISHIPGSEVRDFCSMSAATLNVVVLHLVRIQGGYLGRRRSFLVRVLLHCGNRGSVHLSRCEASPATLW